MRFNLQVAYLSLLSVTCISSLFLFFVVFTENAKYVAAHNNKATVLSATTATEGNAAEEDKPAVPHAKAAATAAMPATMVHDEVLPNNKKLTDYIKNEDDDALLPVLEAAIPADTNMLNNVEREIASDSLTPEMQPADGWLLPNHNAAEIIYDMHKSNNQKDNLEKMTLSDINPKSDDSEVQNEEAESHIKESLPDIKEIPTITVTDLPFEILEPTRGNIDALIIDAAKESIAREHENDTMEMLENSGEMIRKDEEVIKFDDSGGGEQPQPTLLDPNPESSEIPQNIPNVNVTITTTHARITTTPTLPTQNESTSPTTATTSTPTKETDSNNSGSTVNLTVEEVPIPVFSEWAQKQMEAAEKQQAKEQEVVNTSTQKKNHTNGDGKRTAPMKMRNKNYASPDCGAKIIASNADASNTGAVLSSSKDEYMLSPCGNRIWFVVELCEAIQAQKVELANFELFSSSPKNFTIAVSNRFPTRDWSNVGRFIAEDKRNVQSFDLHPHLFGKFVRVDIHSHYSKEHFCPVSLFRVFGTSEFEAFETEDTPNMDLDDFDDEFGQEQVHVKSADTNLFKSASDAVLSIVKKAAEVLVKPANQLNATFARGIQTPSSSQCRTPASAQYICMNCNQPLVARINNVLSCEYKQLQALLKIPWLLEDLQRTQICTTDYGIELKVKMINDNCPSNSHSQILKMDVKQSYYLNMLPTEYAGALCQLLATQYVIKSSTKTTMHNGNDDKLVTEPPLNLTLEKKLKKDDLRVIDGGGPQRKLITTETTNIDDVNNIEFTESARGASSDEDGALPTIMPILTTESSRIEVEQLVRPPQENNLQKMESTSINAPSSPIDTQNEGTLDVNIFNVPAQQEMPEQIQRQTKESTIVNSQREEAMGSGEYNSDDMSETITSIPPTNIDTQKTSNDVLNGEDTLTPTRSEEDVASWENIDNLITSTTVAPGGGEVVSTSSDGAMQSNQPGVNLQQKIPSGPQSESVFIRLSNRIKALERNMSLSGQYLEELSRRYKKQVEDLQLTLTQAALTVRTLEEQSRRQSEVHQLLAQHNAQLKDELDDLSLQVHACIIVIIFVGTFVFLVLMVSILFYRSMRRETKEVLALYTSINKKKSAAAVQRKLDRRKSYEDFSDHQQSSEKLRRPSEEVLMILKERSMNADAYEAIETVGDAVKNDLQRERKISVCYRGNTVNQTNQPASVKQRRKGEKHSWPNTEHAQQQARRHLEQLHATNDSRELIQHVEKLNGRPPRPPAQLNGGEYKPQASQKSARRKSQVPRRQASVPHDFVENTTTTGMNTAEYDESLRLEEDDLDNFIPTSDLAYNEFMPEGPSGYQVDDCPEEASEENEKSSHKSSRLSTSGFFKSPFGKSRNKLRTNKPAKHPHESTSWEWYRLKNSEAKPLSTSASASSGLKRASPTVSLDTSSLSEILLPNIRTENSFRILEEAILSSGESIAASSVGKTITGTNNATDNGNGNSSGNTYTNGSHSNGSSIASNSNRSTTSSTSIKKKNRSFNKIFRKVF